MCLRVLIIGIFSLAFTSNTDADIVTFTNQALWEAETGSYETEDFSDGTLMSGLSVVSDNGTISNGMWNDMVDDPLILSPATTTWNYEEGMTAWSADIDLTPVGGLGLESGLDIQVTFTDMTTHDLIPITTSGFLGIVSDDKVILDVKFSTTSLLGLGLDQEDYSLDNMSSGFSAVPEPGSICLLMMAGSGMLLRRRRSV